MKKPLLILFFLLQYKTSYCQYFEWSITLQNISSSQSASIGLLSADIDYNGNQLLTFDQKPCLLCTHETYFLKRGNPRDWYVGGFNFFLLGNKHKMFGDKENNSFYFGSINKTLNIAGVNTHLFSNTDTLAFLKFDTAGVCMWAQNRILRNAYVDYNGNSYLIDDSLLTLYNPSGQMQWQRPRNATNIMVDTASNYFQYYGGNLVKFDSSGVAQWQLAVNSNTYFFTRLRTRLFVRTGILTSEIDLNNGSILNTSGYGGDAYDSKGNYYNSTYTYKNDTNGVSWQFNLKDNGLSTIFSSQMDISDNIYGIKTIDMAYLGTAHDLFIPPNSYYYNDPRVYTYYSAKIAAYKISPYDTLENGTILTGDVKAICAKGSIDVQFTLNNYYVQYYDQGFSVEISDSSGCFAFPIVIGTGNRSPIACNIPYFNLSGNNYRIRVVSNTTPKITGSSNALPLTSYQSASPQITFSNFSSLLGSSCLPFTMFIDPPGPYSCSWYKNSYSTPNYFAPFGSGLSVSPSPNGDDYKVYITDTVTGCEYELRKNDVFGSTNNYLRFNLPTSICSNEGPVYLTMASLHGQFTGNGIYGNHFYPDSVGIGQAAITYVTFDTVPCYSPDTTLFIEVDSCVNPLKTLQVNQGLKNKFCDGDSLIVDFEADTNVFPAGTKFYLQLSYPGGFFGFNDQIIDSSYTTPFKTIAKAPYFSTSQYRLRAITLTPYNAGTNNIGGYISISQKPYIHSFYSSQNLNTNCGYGINVLTAEAEGTFYTWHHDSVTYVDTIQYASGQLFTGLSSSFLATAHGYYWVEIVNEGGCVSVTDSILITDSTQMVFGSINPTAATKCALDSVLISVVTDSTSHITWSYNATPFTPNDPLNIVTSAAGNYVATVSNSFGCKKQLTSLVSNNIISATIQTLSSYVCFGDSVRLWFNNTPGFTGINWYKDGVLQPTSGTSFYAKDSGNYYFSFLGFNGCVNFSDTLNIGLRFKPIPSFTQDTLYYCAGANSITLQATCSFTGNTPYKWNLRSGSIQSNIITATNFYSVNVNPNLSNGIYVLNVSADCPSYTSDTLIVLPYTPTPIVLSCLDSTTFCVGDSALLVPSVTNAGSYLWLLNGTDTLSNDTTSTLYAFTQGSYSVTISDSVCHPVSNTITITTPCVTAIPDHVDFARSITLIPNPAKDYLQLISPLNCRGIVFQITEVSGKIIETGIIKNTVTTIGLFKLSRGLYFIKAGSETLRFIKL